MTYVLVALGVLLNVGAQIALKFASTATDGSSINPLNEPWRVLISWPFMLGVFLYGISVLNWVVVLSRIGVSVAYPIMSVGYILTLLAGLWFFHEQISTTKVFGIVTIIVGVVLITRPVTNA